MPIVGADSQPNIAVFVLWQLAFVKMNLANVKFSVVAGLVVTIVTTLQAIILAPALISMVGVTVYGAWVVIADVLVLLQIFDFGITAYAAQKIASAKVRSDYATCSGHVFATITLVVVLLALMIPTCVWIINNAEFFEAFPPERVEMLRNCALIGVASVGLQLLGYSFIAPSRALQNLSIVNLWSVVGAFAGFVSMLAFLGMGYELYAAAIGVLVRSFFNLIGGGISIFSLRSIVGFRNLNKSTYLLALNDQLKGAPSTFLGNCSLLSVSLVDNILLGRFAGFDFVAIYSVSRKIFDLCRSVMDIVSYSSYGGLSASLAAISESSRSRYICRYLVIVMIVAVALIVPAYSVSDIFVSFWVGREKYAGAVAVAFIASAAFLSNLSNILFGSLRAQGEFRAATINITVELLVKVAMGVLLVPLLGLVGMPLASMVGAIVMLSLSIYLVGPVVLFCEIRKNENAVALMLVAGVLSCASLSEYIGYLGYVFKAVSIAISLFVLRRMYLSLGGLADVGRFCV